MGRRCPDLLTLAKRIVTEKGIEESELRSRIRKRAVVRARRLFYTAIGRMGYPRAEVAHFLGGTTSSVNRFVVSEEASDLDKYLKLF